MLFSGTGLEVLHLERAVWHGRLLLLTPWRKFYALWPVEQPLLRAHIQFIVANEAILYYGKPNVTAGRFELLQMLIYLVYLGLPEHFAEKNKLGSVVPRLATF